MVIEIVSANTGEIKFKNKWVITVIVSQFYQLLGTTFLIDGSLATCYSSVSEIGPWL